MFTNVIVRKPCSVITSYSIHYTKLYDTTILILFSVFLVSCDEDNVKSPDQSVNLTVEVDDAGSINFDVTLKGDTVVKRSPLGILFESEGLDFSHSLKQTGFEQKVIDEEYTMFVGKQTKRRNHCTQAVYSFQNKEGGKLDVIFRVFNDAVAFCYQAHNNEATSVVKELSSFNFSSVKNTWSIPYSSGDERFFTKKRNNFV